MTSPARRHLERHMAAAAARQAGAGIPGVAAPMPERGAAAQEYRLLLVQLGEDLRRLSNIQSVERKIEAKREMIPRYYDWIEGAVTAPIAAQDEIVATMLVWTIDIGNWRMALALATHVLRHGLTLPERYRRTPATLIAEEVAEAGLIATPTVDLMVLQHVEDLTAKHDMPDVVRAKLQKALGIAFKARFDTFDPAAAHAVAGGKPALAAAALTHLERALALDPRCSVKSLIQQIQREMKKLTEAALTAAD